MGIKNRLNQVATVAYSSVETLHKTYDLTLQVNHIPGCLVECGVGAGAQLMAMALAYTNKDIIGFDSFEGIPLASEHDLTQPGIGKFTPADNRLVSSGITVHSVENVISNFTHFQVGAPYLRLIKGWFQNTVHKFTQPIALLRLDGDLYESTLVCLQHLYPLVSPGGVVIIDDYGLHGCKKAVSEYFEVLPELIPIDGKGPVYFYKK